jgi:hypothetical protein
MPKKPLFFPLDLDATANSDFFSFGDLKKVLAWPSKHLPRFGTAVVLN